MFLIPFGTREHRAKGRFHALTIIFLLINIAVFAIQVSLLVSGGESALADFIHRFAVIPADITDGSFWS